MAAPKISRSITLEVERKFLCSDPAVFYHNHGHPRLPNLKFCGERQFKDVYYDRDDILSKAGVWVRYRNDKWQAKLRRGGNFLNSQFEEITEPEQIAEHIDLLIPGQRSLHQKNFGLDILAVFQTHRHSWTADQRFKIDIDITDFGHTVGEVEIEDTIGLDEQTPTMNKEYERNLYLDSKTKEMDHAIDEFMMTHRWAFPTGDIRGKLSAYFESIKNKDAKLNTHTLPSPNDDGRCLFSGEVSNGVLKQWK